MLNNQGERELAYVVRIDNISGMDADNLECAHVRGWNIVVGKKEFEPGDLAIYFEIDSKLPEVEPFTSMEFLKSKHYKIKSQKIRGVVSQGLLVPASAFGWQRAYTEGMYGDDYIIVNPNPPKDPSCTSNYSKTLSEGDFLTKQLGVTYAVVEDNKRKSNSDKYKQMAQRHPKLVKTKIWKRLYKSRFGKKFLFLLFGRKRDVKREWPSWVVKTDEERCQNLVWSNYWGSHHWVVTEKIDGTSTTFTCKRKKSLFGDKFEYLVCSRNVVFNKPDKKCFYETNYYTQMSEKYDVEQHLIDFLKSNPDVEWVTLQGETFGPGIQKRDYSQNEVDFKGFNFITSKDGRWDSIRASKYWDAIIPWVPIIETDYTLPRTAEEMVEYADGLSVIDNKLREGVVLRDSEGKCSFKAVSNKYLLDKKE